MGELDIELGRLEYAFGLGLGGPRRLQGLAPLIDDVLCHILRLLQRQRAIQLPFGKFDLGARIRKLAVGLRGDRLERPRVDKIEKIAVFYESAVAEFHVCNKAADAGTNLNLLDRIEPPRELVPIRDGSFDGLGHGDRWRRRGRGLRRLLLFATGQ